MKIHKTQIGSTKIESWNDSNASWVVNSNYGSVSFDKRKFTMKEAVKFYCEIYKIGD